MDETGWRTAGERRALWGIFDQRHAYFAVEPDRHEDHAKELLADTNAIVTSDRWWAYAHLAAPRAASSAGRICGATSRRTPKDSPPRKNSASTASRCASASSGPGRSSSTPAIAASSKRTVRSLQRQYKPIIRSYAAKRARNKRCRGMARNLLKAWPALWTFAAHNGVQPTNNHAERALRSAVIYRKLSLGSQSQEGEQRTARLLSAHTTCRLQRRSLFAYLTDAIAAHARGDPAPLLT